MGFFFFVLLAKLFCHCLDLVALPVIVCNLEIGFSFCNSKIQLKIKLALIRIISFALCLIRLKDVNLLVVRQTLAYPLEHHTCTYTVQYVIFLCIPFHQHCLPLYHTTIQIAVQQKWFPSLMTPWICDSLEAYFHYSS